MNETQTGRVAVGVDLGATNVRAALIAVGDGGRVLAEAKAPIADRAPEAVAALVESLVARVDGDYARHGIGIGFAGMLRGWTGVVANAPNFGWREVDFRRMLRARLGPGVELYNDLNAIAYGEATYGGGRGAPDVLCVYVGTGIGAGLVVDGRLYIGAHHLAGEIGHVKVASPSSGRPCGCGARGCIEAYASGQNLVRRVREELAGRPASASRALQLAGSLEAVHAGFLDEAAREGDPYALALWEEVTPLLGQVLANAVTLVNPSHLILGGGVWEGAPDFRRRVLEELQLRVNAASAEGLTICGTTLGDSAGVLGSAALIAAGELH